MRPAARPQARKRSVAPVCPVARPRMGAPGSELLGRKRQCSLGGRRGEGSSWVHKLAPNAFSGLSIFDHCVSRQGVHVVERYQDWRLNNVLPAGNEQYRVNQTSVHCKTCGRALGVASTPARTHAGTGAASAARTAPATRRKAATPVHQSAPLPGARPARRGRARGSAAAP